MKNGQEALGKAILQSLLTGNYQDYYKSSHNIEYSSVSNNGNVNGNVNFTEVKSGNLVTISSPLLRIDWDTPWDEQTAGGINYLLGNLRFNLFFVKDVNLQLNAITFIKRTNKQTQFIPARILLDPNYNNLNIQFLNYENGAVQKVTDIESIFIYFTNNTFMT